MPDFSIEQSFNQNVIGIDEVGRGPLAGPVISCAFIFFDTSINPKDLLYAVMNDAPKEVPAVSLKNTMSSADPLKVIKIELKKSNLKVDPKVILAEVERTINDDFFQNNFLKSLKRRITNVATAVASRNN